MSPTTPSSRFFGVDLHALWPELCRPWQGMHQWPVLAWLTPDLPVRVLHADGRDVLWLGKQPAVSSKIKATAQNFEAIELPDSLLLRRSLKMPALPDAQIAQAALLDIHSASPFAPADLVWGYSAQKTALGALRVDVVFASGKQVARYLEAQKSRLTGAVLPEVWAFTPEGTPLVLSGWGEARRTGRGTLRRRWGYALLLSAAGMVGAMAVTPTAQLRLRAIEAVNAYTEVHQRTTPIMAEREAFVGVNEKLEGLRALLAERADPIQLIEILTQLLPDDTSLQTLQVQGLKVSINGLTTDAAALIQLLSAKEGFKEVRSPSAAVRSPGATADNFTIEFQLDPAVLSIAAAAPAATASVAAPEAPASAPELVASSAAAASSLPVAVPVAAPAAATVPVPVLPAPSNQSSAPRRKSAFSSGPDEAPPPPPTARKAVP